MPWIQRKALACPSDSGTREELSLEICPISTSFMRRELKGFSVFNLLVCELCLCFPVFIVYCRVFNEALQRYEEHPERVGECFIQFVSHYKTTIIVIEIVNECVISVSVFLSLLPPSLPLSLSLFHPPPPLSLSLDGRVSDVLRLL